MSESIEDDRPQRQELMQLCINELPKTMDFMLFFGESTQPTLQILVETWWHGIGDWQS